MQTIRQKIGSVQDRLQANFDRLRVGNVEDRRRLANLNQGTNAALANLRVAQSQRGASFKNTAALLASLAPTSVGAAFGAGVFNTLQDFSDERSLRVDDAKTALDEARALRSQQLTEENARNNLDNQDFNAQQSVLSAQLSELTRRDDQAFRTETNRIANSNAVSAASTLNSNRVAANALANTNAVNAAEALNANRVAAVGVANANANSRLDRSERLSTQESIDTLELKKIELQFNEDAALSADREAIFIQNEIINALPETDRGLFGRHFSPEIDRISKSISAYEAALKIPTVTPEQSDSFSETIKNQILNITEEALQISPAAAQAASGSLVKRFNEINQQRGARDDFFGRTNNTAPSNILQQQIDALKARIR